jgi:amidase
VPFLLKDILGDCKGVPSTSACRFFTGLTAPFDSELVVRYKRAGFIPLGKTNAPELGILPTTEPLLYGPSRNPWNTLHSTGGSSGGSAAAVAAGIVPIAHANDGGGSIRIPASCWGWRAQAHRACNPRPMPGIMDGLVCDTWYCTATTRRARLPWPRRGDPAPPPGVLGRRGTRRLRIAFGRDFRGSRSIRRGRREAGRRDLRRSRPPGEDRARVGISGSTRR